MVFRQRSEAAFESLYARHAREVYGYALAMLGAPADAEDVTQTTFLNAYRAYQRGERPSKPRGWLFAIALNVCRQRWRQASRRPHEVSLDDSFAVADEPEGPSAQDIARALQALPFNQRAALVMRELEGRRQDEIAAELGVSVSAVETLLFRARRGVREQLESSLTCGEAARAISRQLDGGASRADRAALGAGAAGRDPAAAAAPAAGGAAAVVGRERGGRRLRGRPRGEADRGHGSRRARRRRGGRGDPQPPP
jgi:RNA polymerase sigma factor (sigma-70 family)